MMRAFMVVFLFATTCGFAEPEIFTGRRVGDGISSWEDLGALPLCLANERIGPEGSPVGGFCVDRNTPNEAVCNADDDCGARERCVCGRCTVQYCTTNGECGRGWSCSFTDHRCVRPCGDDADCEGAAFCRNGGCTGRCGSDDDCAAGEICGGMGRCVVADCADDSGCLSSEICKVQRVPRATAEPTVLASEDGTEIVMWLELANATGSERAIWRAVSADGLAFLLDPASPVLEDGGDARAPSVLRIDNGYRLYYETATGISVADSPDGVSFGTPTQVIPGDYHAPAAAATGSDVLVYVEVGDRDAIALWRGSGAPAVVFRPEDAIDPVLWRAVERVGSPYVLVEESSLGPATVRLWFDAFGTESGASIQFGEIVAIPPNDSLGYAAAPASDPGAFVSYPWNPILDRVVAFLDHRAERSPAVVRLPGTESWLLYYGGWSADGTQAEGIGVARNPPR